MPERPRILVTLTTSAQARHFCDEARQNLENFADVVYNNTDSILGEAELSERIADVDGLLTGWDGGPLTPANLDAATRLKIITLIGSSVRRIEPFLAIDRGIVICNTARAIGHAVADYTLASIFCSLRHIVHHVQTASVGDWWSGRVCGTELRGKRLGIIGLGEVGRLVVKMLRMFDCEITAYDPYAPPEVAKELGVRLTSLDELMSTSQIVTLHAGVNEESRGMIGAKELALLQDGAVLINTARGELIDELALIAELKKGRITAALDVTDPEPPTADSELRTLPNCIVTAHVAGYTHEMLRRVGLDAVEDLRLFFAGEPPLNQLTKEIISRAT